MRALFDSNNLIDYLAGVAAARTEVSRYEQPAISVITRIEVMLLVTRNTKDFDYALPGIRVPYRR